MRFFSWRRSACRTIIIIIVVIIFSLFLSFCFGPFRARGGGAERRWAITPTKWRVKMQAEKQRDIKRWERGESGAVEGHGRCSGGVSRHFKRVIWGGVSVKWKANVASYYLFILIFFTADLVRNVMLLQGGPSRGSQARVMRLWLWPERGCWVIISKLLLLACQWWWWCSFWGRSGCHTHFWGVTCNSGASPAQDVPVVMVGVGFLRTLNHTTHLFCSMLGWGEQRSFEEGNEVGKDMRVFCRKSLSLAQRRQEAHQD